MTEGNGQGVGWIIGCSVAHTLRLLIWAFGPLWRVEVVDVGGTDVPP